MEIVGIVYVTTGAAEFVTRIATRFINRISLPLPIELAEYLTAPPRLPEGVNGRLGTFLTRLVVNRSQDGSAVNITQALEKDADPNRGVIMLDIDAYNTREFKLEDEALGSNFSVLRNVKNEVFLIA